MDFEKLKELRFFSLLSIEEIQDIRGFFTEVEFAADTQLFDQNDPGGIMYVVLEGEVRISARVSHDLKKTLTHVPPGATLGEITLFTSDPRSADACAVVDTKLLEIDTASFEKMLHHNPAAGNKIMIYMTTLISDRLRKTTDMYQQALEWSLSVSGAINLHMDHLITNNVNLSVKLLTGDLIKGRLLKIDHHAAGYVIFMESEDEKLEIIPYNSVVAMSFDKGALDLKPHSELL